MASLHPQNEIENVRALLIEGRLSEIGKRLGLTSGAVAGLAHRLKARGVELPARKPPTRPIQKRRKRRIASPKPPKSTPVTLIEIGKRGCHWPISGAGINTMFCNAVRWGRPSHASYCPYHALKSVNRESQKQGATRSINRRSRSQDSASSLDSRWLSIASSLARRKASNSAS
jgi:hypothetical protein